MGQVNFKGKLDRKQFKTEKEALAWEVKRREDLGMPARKSKAKISEELAHLEAPYQTDPETIPVHLQQWLSAMETRMVALIKEEARAAMTEQTGIDRVDKVARVKCPLPPKTGKKFVGSKVDLRARMDSKLFELFEAEARQKHAGNLSRMLDQVVWTYYGKPPLSFETEDNANQE